LSLTILFLKHYYSFNSRTTQQSTTFYVLPLFCNRCIQIWRTNNPKEQTNSWQWEQHLRW
jgi:hypothetical protein